MIEKIEAGKLLLSEPSLLHDLEFGRSVILLAEHNADGSIGFILNKPSAHFISELIPDIELPFLIYSGGPVDQNSVYFIHSRPDLIPYSSEISEGIYWGGDFEFVKKIINQNKLSESEIRFFLGYSGWSLGQLEQEIKQKSWVVVHNPYKAKIFEIPFQNLWKSQLESLGEKYKIWSNAPENPEFN